MLPALVLAATTTAAPTPATDVCLAMIPPRLAVQLERENPDHALPTLTDAPVDRLMATAASGGWPCPFVAIGDFDGDGNLDRALVLRHKTEPSVRLIVARNEGTKWHIEIQTDWPIKITEASVEPLEAGLYEQTKGGRDAAKQIDNLKSIQSDHAGFLAGPTEGSKRAFFLVNGAWQDIWLED
ncbi:MAG TPA: hypothetical protein VET48_15095 [Steroidobacteraceae bacterium]|nr:hypothetical protein [Steroidobacteraceae bacterium]